MPDQFRTPYDFRIRCGDREGYLHLCYLRVECRSHDAKDAGTLEYIFESDEQEVARTPIIGDP